MAKLLKITGKIIGGILEWLLILIIVIAFAIRTSTVQTKLAELATDYLSKELDTELRIDKVDIYFFDRVALDGVFVRDQQGDTLASLGSVEVVLRSLDLTTNAVTLRNIGLKNGRVGINRDSLTGDYNYWFITDYFDSGPKTNKVKKPIDLTVESLDIEHVNVTYDDYRKSYSDYGMDYDHLGFKDVVLHAKDFKSDGKNFVFKLLHLSTKEKCGIDLRRLKARCRIGKKGIFLDDLMINTSLSRIFAGHFYMQMNGLQQVHTFVDSVTFNAVIDSSAINLKDVSYFAPALKGMSQKVYLHAGLSRKVKDLRISHIDLRTGNKTIVRGNLLLPDFNSLEGSFLKENLDYAYIDLNDLKALRLPDRVEQRFIELNPMISRLGYFEVKKLNLIGYWSQFVLSSRQISTALGTIHLDNGLLFTELKEGGYAFERSANSDYDVYIDSFNLGAFIDNSLLGKVNGSLFMSGVVGQEDIIRLNKLDGIINSFGFNKYNYTNIAVTEGSYIDNVFKAKIDITDPHLELAFDGSIDLNHGQHFEFGINIAKADLGKLHVTKNENTTLTAGLQVDMQGTDLSNYRGTISLNQEFVYTEDSNTIRIPQLELTLTRGGTDHIAITSDVADIDLNGKINPAVIATSLNNALAGPLSAYFPLKAMPRRSVDNNVFDLTVDVKDAQEVLAVFAPDLHIASGTHLAMHYDAPGGEMNVNMTSPLIMYDSIIARNIVLNQTMLNGVVHADLDVKDFVLNDSLYVQNVDVKIDGTNNAFNTVARWNQEMANPAEFTWKTTLAGDNSLAILLMPSYFTVKNQLWEIQNRAALSYKENRMEIDHLVLERDAQFIAVNGILSDHPEDKLTVTINELHLSEFSSFLTTKADIEGNVNGEVRIYTPFTAFRADGDLRIDELVVNQEPVGDVVATGLWDPENSRMVMGGELRYLKYPTFDFNGFYYPYKEKGNLDFDLLFDGMDLQIANAFIEPTLVRDIRGKLKGEIHLSGEAEAPSIDGKLNLVDGNVKIDMLGVSYKLNGPILFDGQESSIYINSMPVVDEEGHTASLNASINHVKFEKWNCDIGIDMEYDYANRNYWNNAPKPLEKFLVLNTTYEEGTIYYGRAYVTGTTNIFVTEDHTSIGVNVKTAKGTWIDIPMYGNSEIEEGQVIRFREKGLDSLIKPELDLSSVDLDLNFDVTEDARVKLIFNDKTHDEITAYGSGQLEIHVNSTNDIAMTGTYTIAPGNRSKYNFVMGPINQIFDIRENGTIIWTGDPYNAALNLVAYNKVQANINEIAPDVMAASANNSSGSQEVRCVMYITQTLNDPLITLDIEAPHASDYGKTLLANIRSSKEETQKQFFSLLLFKKFAPLAGSASVGSGGITDVIEKQLDALLAGMTNEDVKLNIDLENDKEGGNKGVIVGSQVAIGQSRSFILRTSLGVANSTTQTQNQTTFVGDMSLEYLINSDGTFRVNIFNESNDNSVIQDKTQGLFTQGVGLHYQEDFNTMRDFKLIQIILDLFRDDKRVKIKKRRHEEPIFPAEKPKEKKEEVPVVLPNVEVITPEEESTEPPPPQP